MRAKFIAICYNDMGEETNIVEDCEYDIDTRELKRPVIVDVDKLTVIGILEQTYVLLPNGEKVYEYWTANNTPAVITAIIAKESE